MLQICCNKLQHTSQLISSFLFNGSARIESLSWTETDPVVVTINLYWADGWKPLIPLHETVKALSSSLMHPGAGAQLWAIYSSVIRLFNRTGSPGHNCSTYMEGFTLESPCFISLLQIIDLSLICWTSVLSLIQLMTVIQEHVIRIKGTVLGWDRFQFVNINEFLLFHILGLVMEFHKVPYLN